jgi:hypothetical protein
MQQFISSPKILRSVFMYNKVNGLFFALSLSALATHYATDCAPRYNSSHARLMPPVLAWFDGLGFSLVTKIKQKFSDGGYVLTTVSGDDPDKTAERLGNLPLP